MTRAGADRVGAAATSRGRSGAILLRRRAFQARSFSFKKKRLEAASTQSRVVLLLCLLMTLCTSCTRKPSAPPTVPPGGGQSRPATSLPADFTDPYRLRNGGKVHADRDTTEGYLQSAEYFRRLVEVEPDIATHRLNLAKVLVFTDDFEACDAQLKIARALFGEGNEPADLDYVAGLSKKRQQKYEEAVVFFARVTQRRPDHVQAWFQRGYMEELSKRFEDAEKSLRKVLELDPRHRAGAYRLAMVLRRLNRLDEVKKVLELYTSLPKTARVENEKCDLTAVTLRPLERGASEPSEVTFTWRDVTQELVGEETAKGVRRVRFLDAGEEDGSDLLLLGPAGVRIARLRPGKTPEVRDAFARDTGSADTPSIDTGGAVDAVIADFDNDKADEMLLVTPSALWLFRRSPDGGFEPAGAAAPVEETDPSKGKGGEVMDAAAYDADHDGDLDVVLVSKTGGEMTAGLLRNNGDTSFTRLSPFDAFACSRAVPLTFHAHDVDQANDLDFVFAGGAAGVQAFLNRRDGTFSRVELAGFGNRTRVLVEDLNNDGAPDFFATGGDPGWAYALNADRLGIPYELRIEKPVVVPSPRCGEISDAAFADIDNDGDVDVLLATAAGMVVLRNMNGGKLREEDAIPVGKAGGKAGGCRRVTAADLDCDGLLEVLVCTETDSLVVLASGARPAYASLTVRPAGGKDNHDGVGVIVELYAGRLYQSRLVRDGNGVHLGLGKTHRGQIDGLRLRWPQGIVQAVPAADLTLNECGGVNIPQKAGLVASCPFLYARGPNGWSFLTDIIGIAPLDEWLPPRAEPHLDPEEFVRLEGDALAGEDGLLRLAITEELRETAYLDRLELVVVDHPSDTEVFLDESTRQQRYEPLEVAVVSRSDLVPPASVKLEDGTEARPAVFRRDREYVHGYADAPSQWGGWAERYDLELTTAAPARALLLTGRIAWYDSTVAYSLAQHGRTWGPLTLEHVLGRGRSTTLVDDLGLPAGMDRTMVATFSRMPLPAASKLRLSGQHRFLWDRLFFVSKVEAVKLSGDQGSRRLEDGRTLVYGTHPVRHARLRFHGFSKVSGDRARHEQTYTYEAAAPDDSFPPAVGRATRYGEVTSLLEAHDDLLVVLVAGDGVEVDFAAPPALESGTRRTYFLRVSGWAKEGSFHNRTGRAIEPLPHRGMSRYPPPAEEIRDDEAYRSYLSAYQTRHVRRRAP